MKPFIASILLFAFLSFQLSELIVYVSFKINQDYIAENLCVEKDIEDSTCNGCCQLEKKMNEQEKQKEEIPFPLNRKLEINLYNHITLNQEFIINQPLDFTCYYQNNYHFFTEKSIFHPPQNKL